MVAVALWYIHTAQDQDWKRDREWEQDQWVLIYDAEMFTVVQDRDIHQDLLFSYRTSPVPCTGPCLEKCE